MNWNVLTVVTAEKLSEVRPVLANVAVPLGTVAGFQFVAVLKSLVVPCQVWASAGALAASTPMNASAATDVPPSSALRAPPRPSWKPTAPRIDRTC